MTTTVYAGEDVLAGLFAIVGDGFADVESGTVESPMGWFGLVTDDDGAVWLLVENDQGSRAGVLMADQAAADEAFGYLDAGYSAWLDLGEPDDV